MTSMQKIWWSFSKIQLPILVIHTICPRAKLQTQERIKTLLHNSMIARQSVMARGWFHACFISVFHSFNELLELIRLITYISGLAEKDAFSCLFLDLYL